MMMQVKPILASNYLNPTKGMVIDLNLRTSNFIGKAQFGKVYRMNFTVCPDLVSCGSSLDSSSTSSGYTTESST